MPFQCGTCGREFYAGWYARDQHCEDTGHRPPEFECWECDRHLDDQEYLGDQMVGYGHIDRPSYECRLCNLRNRSEEARRQHEREYHLWCGECDRYFQNFHNLNQHLHSSLHRETSIQCPFCGETRGTATGLVHHLENGCCPVAPLNRDDLYQQVRQRDPQGVISKHLIGWTGSAEYTATERSWSHRLGMYECKLCGRAFATLQALNQHLSSPLHQEKYYHCPKRVCARSFTTLAALINHLESGSCGFTTFGRVQRDVQSLVDPSRRIAFR